VRFQGNTWTDLNPVPFNLALDPKVLAPKTHGDKDGRKPSQEKPKLKKKKRS